MPVPVAEWPIEIDEAVLIFVVHPNAAFASTADELAHWQGWCVGRWIDHNGGGWTWHGHLGTVTHVAALPPVPTRDELALARAAGLAAGRDRQEPARESRTNPRTEPMTKAKYMAQFKKPKGS